MLPLQELGSQWTAEPGSTPDRADEDAAGWMQLWRFPGWTPAQVTPTGHGQPKLFGTDRLHHIPCLPGTLFSSSIWKWRLQCPPLSCTSLPWVQLPGQVAGAQKKSQEAFRSHDSFKFSFFLISHSLKMPNPGFLVCFLLLFVYVFFYLSYLVFSELPESAVSFLLLIWEKFSAVITLNSSPVYFFSSLLFSSPT